MILMCHISNISFSISAVTRVPSNPKMYRNGQPLPVPPPGADVHLHRLPNGQVVRLIPVNPNNTVPRIRAPVQAKARKYEMRSQSPRPKPVLTSQPGMYRKNPPPAPTVTANNNVPVKQPPVPAPPPNGPATGWQNLPMIDKLTI